MRQVNKFIFGSTLLISAILFLVLVFAPLETAQAQGLVPCDGKDCNFCHVVQLGNNVLNWFFGAVFVIFTIVMFSAGFGLVTSAGNTSKLEEAKGRLMNGIMGILIAFSAWLIVDTLLKATISSTNESGDTVAGETVLGPWNEIECSGGQNAPSGTSSIPPGLLPPDGVLDWDPVSVAETIEGQMIHASPEVAAFLACMAANLPGDVGRVSSISDSDIMDGDETFYSCVVSGCAHSNNSCHYGGPPPPAANGCGPPHNSQSYAVDFGDEENAAILIPQGLACGAGGYFFGDPGHLGHIHFSLGNGNNGTPNCGCDAYAKTTYP